MTRLHNGVTENLMTMMTSHELLNYALNSAVWAFVGYQLAVIKERVKNVRRDDDQE
jgi:hypothetical protein